jgi:hypothetical protein
MRPAIKTVLFTCAASIPLFTAPSVQAALPAKACDLMTQSTATAIYGRPVAAGRYEMATVGISDCRFDGPNGGFAEIGLMDPKGMNMSAPDMFKLSTHPDAGETVEIIPVLGEAATLKKGPDDTSLFVLIHGLMMELTSDRGSTPAPALKAALIQAARVALAKL